MSRIQQLKGKFLEASEQKICTESKTPPFGQSQLRAANVRHASSSESKTSAIPKTTFERSKLFTKRVDPGEPPTSKPGTIGTHCVPDREQSTTTGALQRSSKPYVNRPFNSALQDANSRQLSARHHSAQTAKPEANGDLKSRILDLETENKDLRDKVQSLESNQPTLTGQSDEMESMAEELKRENAYLKSELRTLQVEMDEMQDQFKDEGEQGIRDLQKELEVMAKNYRISQFKLKKADRKIEQLELEKQQSEEHARQIHESYQEGEDRNHVRELEQELQMSKEVSVRLHSDIENLEEKCSKLESENEQLSEELKQSHSKQKHLEKEIQRLQLALEDTRTASGSPMVTFPSSKLGDHTDQPSSTSLLELDSSKTGSHKQSTHDYDMAQVMRDLYDSIEREQDMKEQLKFSEEEAKIIRRKLADLESENESLIAQLKKMSDKSPSKGHMHKRTLSKEKERSNEADEGDNAGDYKLQTELAEQENHVLRKRINELSSENENLFDEVKFLQEKLRDAQQDEGTHRSAADIEHYDAAIRVMMEEIEELKWKLVEKDRELELARIIGTKKSEGSEGRRGSLVRSRSVESEGQPGTGISIKQQLELLHEQVVVLKERNEALQVEVEQLRIDNDYLKTAIPSEDKPEEDVKSSREYKRKIANLEEELNDLLIIIKSRDTENTSLGQQVAAYESDLDDLKRTTEMADLRYKDEIDNLKKKNEILSNCLITVSERVSLDKDQRSDVEAVGQDLVLPPSTNGNSGAQATVKNWDDTFNKHLQTLKNILEVERPHPSASKTPQNLGSRGGMLLEHMDSWDDELQECVNDLRDASDNISSISDRMRKIMDAYETHFSEAGYHLEQKSESRRREQLREDVKALTKSCSKHKNIMEKLQATLERVVRKFSSLQTSWDKEKARIMDEVHENVNGARQAKQRLLEKEGMLKSRERQLEQANVDINELRLTIREKEGQLKCEKNALAHNAKLLESLDKEVKKLEAIVQDKNIEIYEKDETCRLLREDCKLRDGTIEQKTGEMKILAKKLQTFEGKIISYVSQVGSLEQMVKQSDFEISKREKLISSLKDQVKELESQCDVIRQKRTKDVQSFEDDICNLKRELLESKKNSSTLQMEIKKQKEVLVNERAKWAKVEQGLKMDLASLRQEMVSVEVPERVKETGRFEKLQSENRELTQFKIKLESEVEKLRRDIDDMEECNAFEKEELQSILAEKVEIIQEMHDSDAELKNNLNSLQKKIQEQSVELQKARSSALQRSDDEIRTIQSSQMRKLRQEKSDLRKQYLLELELHEDTKQDLAKLRAQFDHEQDNWTFEKELLSKQIYEAKDKRTQVITLQKMVENLKIKLRQSENTREELELKHSSERLDWDVRVAELQTTINKLEEQKPLPRFPIKAKDKRKAELENNWERERSELRRIVAEAHSISSDQKLKMESMVTGETFDSLLQERLSKEEEIHRRELLSHEATIRELHLKLNNLLGLKMELAETKTRFKREEAGWDVEKQTIQSALDEVREIQDETRDIVDQFILKLKLIKDAEEEKKKPLENNHCEITSQIKKLVSDLETRRQQEKTFPTIEIKTRGSRPSSLEGFSNGLYSTSTSTRQFPIYSPLKAPPPKYPDPPPSIIFSKSSQSGSPSPRSSFRAGTGFIKGLSVDTPSSAQLWSTINDWKKPSSGNQSPSKTDRSPVSEQRKSDHNANLGQPLPSAAATNRPSTLPLTKHSRSSPVKDLRDHLETSAKGGLTKPSPTSSRKKFLDNFLSLNFGKKNRKDYSEETQSERGRSESPGPAAPKSSKSKGKKLLQKSHSLDESSLPGPSVSQKSVEKSAQVVKSSKRSFFKRSSSLETSSAPETQPTAEIRRYASEEDLASRTDKGKSLFRKFKFGAKK